MDNNDLASLKRIAMFALVVDHGSFARAAQVLGVSRSRVSEQVRLLEESLSARLLQRTTRKLALTQAGERIYDQAASVLGTLDSIKNSLSEEAMAGRVRITATQDFASRWLSPKLAAFKRQHPDIYFELVLSDSRLDLVENQIDIAIRVGQLKDDSLIVRPLFQQTPLIYASHAYLEQRGAPLTIESIVDADWIVLPQMQQDKQVELFNGSRTLRFRPRRAHLCDSPLVMLEMIKQGMGLGLHMPNLLSDSEAKSITPVLSDWHFEPLHTSLAYPSRLHIPKRTRSLIDFLMGFDQ